MKNHELKQDRVRLGSRAVFNGRNLLVPVLLSAAIVLFQGCKTTPIVQEETTTAVAGKSEGSTKSSVLGYYKDNSTSVTTIDATPGYTHVVLYTVGPMNVAAGDVVTVHFQRQFGMVSGAVAPIMVAGGILAATSATANDTTSPGFIGMVCGWAGSNMTATEAGREVVTRTGSYKFTSAANGVYINAVYYGQALTGAGGSGDLALPTGNYGELVAVLESGVTWSNTTASPLPYNSTYSRDYVPFTPVLNVHNTIGPLTATGDVMVDVRYDAQATTELFDDDTYQTYGRNIVQGTAATSTSGVNLTKQTQVGITHREHHSEWSNAGGAHYGSGFTNAYFNSVVYSNGWEGQNLYLDPGSANLYNKMQVEVRPYKFFAEDSSNDISTIDGTPRVLYSVPVGAVTAGEVIEVRYQAAFATVGSASVDSKIVRAASATDATGTVMVQNPLVNPMNASYYRNQLMHSTAEQIPTTTSTPQFYNVVVWKISGSGTVTPQTWGELEVIRR